MSSSKEVYNLTFHPKKCLLGATEILSLGYVITPTEIAPQEAKVKALKKLPIPKDVPHLRAWLGLGQYYRKMVQNWSRICNPLNKLLCKDEPWIWGEAQQAAYDQILDRLCAHPVIRMPCFKKPFIVHCDWSSLGIGAVLAQKDAKDQKYVICTASRSCNTAEMNYSSFDGEALAVTYAVRIFRPYLIGKRFTVYTDHRPLLYLMRCTTLSGKHARWAMLL
jgi:RNase H-like domain found in reverse transcriptase